MPVRVHDHQPEPIPADIMQRAAELRLQLLLESNEAIEIIAEQMVAERAGERELTARRLSLLTDQEIRLHMGEMSVQEMRTLRAFIKWQVAAIRKEPQ